MNCEDCNALFIDKSRGELTTMTLGEVEAHLDDCDACSGAYAKLLQMQALLDAVEQPSPELALRFRQRLAQETRNSAAEHSPAAKRRPGLFDALWPARPAWAFAYSVLLLSCGLVSGQLLPDDSLGFRTSENRAGQTGGPENVNIAPDQLAQMCAVQRQQAPDFL